MRIILFTLSVLALLFIAAVVGPGFVDWNKYKPQIIEQVKNATGLDVQVSGDLSLSVLPSPRVKIEGLVVGAPKKIQFENLLSMKSAEVSVALMPLLQKKIEVNSLTLVEPIIQIELMQDGTPSWMSDKLSKAQEVVEVTPGEVKKSAGVAAGAALDSVALNRLEIKDGQLAFIDHKTKASHSAGDINLVLKAGSLKGPFDIDGALVYEDQKITLEAKTGKLPTAKANEALSIQAALGIPDAKSNFTFNGVAAIKAPYDVQGQTIIKIASAAKLAGLFGIGLGAQYDREVMLDGLLSADEDKLSYNDLKISFGKLLGNGKFSVQNLKNKNPLGVSGDLKFSSMIDLDPFLSASTQKSNASNQGHQDLKQGLKTAGKTSAKKQSLIPQTLTLPMPVDLAVKIDMAGVKVKGKQVKGVFVDLNKKGSASKVKFKALELPGQGKADGALNISYGSSSKSPKTGQVVYSDPTVSYQVNGHAGQLETFLKAFAPKADTSAVTKLYKTAQFNLKGSVSGNVVSLKDSTLKLDQMVLGLGGRYQAAANGGRAKAVIDLTAGEVDFDRIMQAKGGKKAAANDDAGETGAASGTPSNTSKKSAKEALKPVQGLSLPLDLVFDISLQKARINKADLNGLRLTGDLTGQKLTLKNASVNNFAGAAMSLKGQVGNLSNLSGLDLNFYTKTNNLGALAKALKADISKLPKGLSSVEANISGKGKIEALTFSSNIKALGGQLDAAGNAEDILGTPSFDNLTIGLKHSNLVKAIQIMSPDFKGSAALQQPIDFHTKASSNGKVYNLSDMKVKLGQNNFSGNLIIDTKNKIPAISGNIEAGKLALDKLLGAKTASAKSGSSGNNSAGGSSSSSSKSSAGGRWSKTPIDLGWMNNVKTNVNLAASSITYGGWNFTRPSTRLKIAGGVLSINDMKAGVFGGQASLTTEVKADPVSLTLSSKMNNIDLESLAKALSGGSKLKSAGKVSLDMNVASRGGSAYALINALGGKADLDGRDVILKGFDLVKLARGLATEEKLAISAASLVDGAMSGGQTKFDTVKGEYKIEKGTVKITSMIMDSAEAVINTTGYADLPNWLINTDNEIMLKNVSDLEPFNVKIKGPLNNPSDTFGKNIFEDYLGAKLKRKIGKELPDILGDDVTDKLKKFGILPQDQAPAPAPAPAPVEGDSASPPQQQAPAQPVQPEQQPADPLQQILQDPAGAEDAVKDMLKGLF